MDLKQYQHHVANKMRDLGFELQNVHHWVYGITGELGELVDHIKKKVFYRSQFRLSMMISEINLDKDYIKKEIGDIFFYLTALSVELGLDVEDILVTNIDKLNKRHGETFNQEWASNRIEEQ